MSALDDEYEYDWIIYALSNSIEEEEYIENAPLKKVLKRMMMKKFDNWMQEEISEAIKKKQ